MRNLKTRLEHLERAATSRPNWKEQANRLLTNLHKAWGDGSDDPLPDLPGTKVEFFDRMEQALNLAFSNGGTDQ